MEQPIDRLPIFAAGVGLHRVGKRAAGFEQLRGPPVGGARLDLTELFHPHLFEVRTQHFVIPVTAAIIGVVDEDLPALECLENLLSLTPPPAATTHTSPQTPDPPPTHPHPPT